MIPLSTSSSSRNRSARATVSGVRRRAAADFQTLAAMPFGRPAFGDLRLAALRIVLHGQGQFLQQHDGPIRRRPPRPLLAGPRQPGDDRVVQVGPLFRQPAFVPMDDGQRGEHHGIAGHAADFRPPADGGQQLVKMRRAAWRLSPYTAPHHRARNVSTAPSDNGSMRASSKPAKPLAGVRRRTAGDDETAVPYVRAAF